MLEPQSSDRTLWLRCAISTRSGPKIDSGLSSAHCYCSAIANQGSAIRIFHLRVGDPRSIPLNSLKRVRSSSRYQTNSRSCCNVRDLPRHQHRARQHRSEEKEEVWSIGENPNAKMMKLEMIRQSTLLADEEKTRQNGGLILQALEHQILTETGWKAAL
jgi:hypothetical protein